MSLPGSLIGSRHYVNDFPKEELDDWNKTFSLIEGIFEARNRFLLRRVCVSSCNIEHVEKLPPPSATSALAQRFDSEQMEYYAPSNHVPMPDPVRQQARLPLSAMAAFKQHSGHCLTLLAMPSFAALATNIITS